MKQLTLLFIVLSLGSCDFRSSNRKDNPLNQDLIVVADSISLMMSKYHYNPAELATDEYLDLEKKVMGLAETVETKQEFMDGFNALWKNGPFSHVTLGTSEKSADQMAEFIDSLRVGDHSVSLQWRDTTAILTVTTMTGIDTKERVFEAYRKIAEKETTSLVIDLRNNTGGTFAGVPLIGHVLTDSLDAGIFVSRKWWENHTRAPKLEDVQDLVPWQGWSLKSFWHDVQDKPLTRVRFGPMQPHFDGPVYVLISDKSASAAEFAVDALAHEEKVTIIGETTAGEMLSQKMFDLPQGLQLSLPIAEYYSTRIGRIEGTGVQPDITVDHSVAKDLALSLIDGMKLDDALPQAQQKVAEMMVQPLADETIYLFGNMNDWGKKWNITPRFEYKGNGIYETSTTFKKGRYEFKIAPMNWNFDYGAKPDQEKVVIGQKTSLARVPGSSNLILVVEEEAKLTFSLDVSDEKAAVLQITKN
ncbi:S41 family peptidase [Allomuricauda sp. SCSIO 65647]|uniref:S41 family peptidase n=1 Tax=Allomuricauda sp. SCSIO 65647 TaxID=2908843 RepID=UPI001F3F2457|nr:S41 family peptidase [Muricauda sp. SCSIO 65647]UJH68905.1 S41 family peptidase [Muricauda sp. SCSIO 65647]